MNRFFVCWIPILTPYLNFKKRVEEFISSNNLIKHFTSEGELICMYETNLADDSPEKLNLSLHFDKFYKLKKINLLRENYEVVPLANIIKIYKNGLTLFEVNPEGRLEGNMESLAKQVYVVLKDIYHVHTHHHKEMDLLLLPVERKTEKRVGYVGK